MDTFLFAMPFLYQVDAHGCALRRWELCARQELVIGREPHADIAVSEDGCLSARHFTLQWKPDGFEVEDLRSKNGIWVNGERVTRARVQLNDRIRAGHTRFLLEAGLATMLGQLLQDAPATPAV